MTDLIDRLAKGEQEHSDEVAEAFGLTDISSYHAACGAVAGSVNDAFRIINAAGLNSRAILSKAVAELEEEDLGVDRLAMRVLAVGLRAKQT